MRTNKAALVKKEQKRDSVRIVAKAASGSGDRSRRTFAKPMSGTVSVVFSVGDMPDELYATCVVLAKKHGTELAQEMVSLIAKGVDEELDLEAVPKKRTKKRRERTVNIR